jgi:hypothetical protein
MHYGFIYIIKLLFIIGYKSQRQSSTFVLFHIKAGGLTYMVIETVAIYVFLDDIFKSMQS